MYWWLTNQQRIAQECEERFPNSSALDIDPEKRQLKDYLIYGRDDKSDFDTKQLTLIGLTGMLKCIATTKDLRVAHDKLGRLKRVKTPYGVESYMTAQWDQLVSFPTSESKSSPPFPMPALPILSSLLTIDATMQPGTSASTV